MNMQKQPTFVIWNIAICISVSVRLLFAIGTLQDLCNAWLPNTHDISVPIENIAIPLNNSYEFIQLETSATIS